MSAAESKKGLSLLGSMSSVPRLLLIFDALGIEHPPKKLLPTYYQYKIAKKLNKFKSNIHVTFNSDFSVLLSLSDVKEARKEGGQKYLYTNEKGIIVEGGEGGGGEGRPPTPPPTVVELAGASAKKETHPPPPPPETTEKEAAAVVASITATALALASVAAQQSQGRAEKQKIKELAAEIVKKNKELMALGLKTSEELTQEHGKIYEEGEESYKKLHAEHAPKRPPTGPAEKGTLPKEHTHPAMTQFFKKKRRSSR